MEASQHKMNPEVKAKLVAALRSGDYKQGRTYLNSEKGFCCLGVVCDLHARQGLGKWAEENGISNPTASSYQGQFSILPKKVGEWSGLVYPDFGARVVIYGQAASLAEHNDAGKTFAQIADAIEEQL